MKKQLLLVVLMLLVTTLSFSQDLKTTFVDNTVTNQVSTTIVDNEINSKLFPCPVLNVVTVTSDQIIKSVSIFSILGQHRETIQTNDYSLSINMTKYNSGIYLIIINEKQTLKLYKQ